MSTYYKYNLDNARPAKFYSCPACGEKEFKLYRDNESGEYLSDKVGICNRLVKCNYHYSPKQYFEDNKHLAITFNRKNEYQRPIILSKPQPDFISKELVEKSFSSVQQNNFISYTNSLFHEEITEN